MLNVWIREFFAGGLETQKDSVKWATRAQDAAYTLFQPKVIGRLIDRVEVWCWLTAVNTDGHDRQCSHDLTRLLQHPWFNAGETN